jgi:hypothetical protein
MKKDLTNIIDKLLWMADDVCLDNSKDGTDMNPKNADIVRCPLGQQDWDNVPDKGVRAILQQHKLKLSDILALADAGVMVLADTDDQPGCVIDDRCLHVSMHMDKVVDLMPHTNHNLIMVGLR